MIICYKEVKCNPFKEFIMEAVKSLENQKKILHMHLVHHQLYTNINSMKSLRQFMEIHVYAVWDFMTLLKRLQLEITRVAIPWKPSPYSKRLVRLINEIVLCEESDVDPEGGFSDHFSLYIKAMKEVNANTKPIAEFIESQDYSKLPGPIKKFVSFNIDLAKNAPIHKVAAVFLFGREKLIPEMFKGILKDILKGNSESKYPKLKYYLERHIEVDGGEHVHLANEMLWELCENNSEKIAEALTAGILALKLRIELWDYVQSCLTVESIGQPHLRF